MPEPRPGPKSKTGPSLTRLKTRKRQTDPLVEIIREQRVRRGFTLEKLGEKSGYSHRTLRAWEAGIQSPTLRAFQEVCDVLGLEITLAECHAMSQD